MQRVERCCRRRLRLERHVLRQHRSAWTLHLAARQVRGKHTHAGRRRKFILPDHLEFSSDVCKHCEVAGCLEACPTGALIRTEFGGVYLQPDVCNGCSYCVVSCPFGVVQKNEQDGRAFKCTFCYDRQKVGLPPACAKACPTESIMFGPLDQLRARAQERIQHLHSNGMTDANLYDPTETSVQGLHAFFLVRGDPRAYNLPPKPEVPTIYLKEGWRSAAKGAAMLLAGAMLAFAAGRGQAKPRRRSRR
jgi:formate dehydrogenase iron-sulfur subunit